MILVNGIEGGAVDPRDRGLAYGDGVFRTFPLRSGRPVLWQRQYAKLASDSAALGIACPAASILEADLAKIAAAHADGVIKIVLTRGIAVRGYAIPRNIEATRDVTRIVSWSEFSAAPAPAGAAGVRVRWCNLRLSIQPALAGVKHLNRLENVLARSEWQDAQTAEGLLRDTQGQVIGGTMSNLLLLRDGELMTPLLTGSGIAGVMRELILERARAEGMTMRIVPILPQAVHDADAVFLVNSLIGVWPVAALDDMTWGPSALTAQLRNWISDAENC